MSSNLSHLKDSGLPWVLGTLPRSPPRDSFWEPLNKKKTAAVIAVRVPNGRDLLPASPGQGEKLPPVVTPQAVPHAGRCSLPWPGRGPRLPRCCPAPAAAAGSLPAGSYSEAALRSHQCSAARCSSWQQYLSRPSPTWCLQSRKCFPKSCCRPSASCSLICCISSTPWCNSFQVKCINKQMLLSHHLGRGFLSTCC